MRKPAEVKAAVARVKHRPRTAARVAHALARRLQAGVVWINCFNEFDDAAPFGGFKESGWGRDLSHHALDGFTQLKAVWTKLPG